MTTSSRKWPVAPCDAHLHLYPGHDLEWDIQCLRGYRQWFGIDRMALLALPECVYSGATDPESNARCLEAKARLNRESPGSPVYALAGLVVTGRDISAREYLDQARRALDDGFDGFKSLLGKPNLRKLAPIALDAPELDPFYGFLEENGKPFVLHAGDPATFWDAGQVPASAKANGWFYDETFPPLGQIRAEAENILRKHPGLHATFAHVFFLGDEPDEAERLLETYPNLGLDMAPGWEMHLGFTAHHDRWHVIFEKFADRFFFATDTANHYAAEDISGYDEHYRWALDITRLAITTEQPFDYDCDGPRRFMPLCLSPSAQRKILRENFIRRFGEKPADVSIR